ncbi:DMT family transporter [Azospirillum agricola]|uniref:DMT family transporter n=1 Tax=Azospirillum agricola TaxID=1720247 RepID=UPI000A0F2DA1|nr:DMT family transporter [Azospirillum agricola]SMH60536.1 EamA-like transporter family protein [Azospirillum lipoferum]
MDQRPSPPRPAGLGRGRTALLTGAAMLGFAANSILCRLALIQTTIDPAVFTAVRIASGAASLWLIIALTTRRGSIGGSWTGALALLGYAACFSFAYVSLPAGTGALLLFGAVQATMIAAGLLKGERLAAGQWAGLGLAFAGLVVLLAPGVSAPSPSGALLMVAAGIAWGAYSLLGRSARDPIATTAGNFLRAVPPALLLAVPAAIPALSGAGFDGMGLLYAALSGGLASGVGYALWYAALPALTAARAASVQLSVPVITVLGAAATLGEGIGLILAVSSAAVLGGIALVIAGRRRV